MGRPPHCAACDPATVFDESPTTHLADRRRVVDLLHGWAELLGPAGRGGESVGGAEGGFGQALRDARDILVEEFRRCGSDPSRPTRLREQPLAPDRRRPDPPGAR